MVSAAIFERIKDIARQQRQPVLVGSVDKILAVDAVRQAAPDVDAAARSGCEKSLERQWERFFPSD